MFRLEKEMATHSSVLAWTVEPGGLQSTGSQRVRHDRSDLAHTECVYVILSPQFISLPPSPGNQKFVFYIPDSTSVL